MAKDRKKLQHIHSSISDKQPTPQTLEVGEIAVNNFKDNEFLSVKNTDNKVVRFSSDSTLINWMERKEVMPYEGFTRGSNGPTGSTGPDSVTNSDLLQNKSNIIIKLNQVAASATTKHDKVNGAKDIYGQLVNPTSDGGLNDGAGFAIDMSRYAMIGANPGFSSLTVSDKTDLSGNTTITDGDGTGTRTGKTFTVKVTNENETVTTLNESATTRTTKIGTENLNVSGTTTEVHTGNVTITNSANKTETTNSNLTELVKGYNYRDVNGAYSGTTGGTTTEVKVGNVTENTSGTTTVDRKGAVSVNNQNNVTEVTSGNSTVTISGTSKVNVSGSTTADTGGNVTVMTSGTTTETYKGQVTENNQSGYTINTTGNVIVNTTGTTTETKTGNVTENNQANKVENTTGTHKIYVTGNTCIDSQTNANFYGKVSTNIGVACDGTKGSATTVYGTTTTISGNTTNLTGATALNVSGNTINKKSLTANTNTTSAYTSATTATTVIGTANTSATTATLSGNTLVVNEATSISAKTPTTNLSGTTLGIVETNTDIESCGRISGKTNAFTIQECAAGSGKTVINQTDIDISGKTFDVVETTSTTIKAPATTISGATLALDESTSISAKTPTTNISGTTLGIVETNTTIQSCGKVEITTDAFSLKQCSESGGSAEFEFCNGYTVKSNNINLQQCGTAGTINISAQTQNISGGTLNIKESGDTNITTTGSTNITATQNICESANALASFRGATETRIGKTCANDGQTGTLNLNGNTINETGTTVNINGSTTTNISGGTINIKSTGSTNVTAGDDFCVDATDSARVYGKGSTYLGVNCAGTAGSATTVEGTTLTVSGNTTNITGATTLNVTGATINVDASTYDLDATNVCVSGSTKANFYGKETNIGVDCNGTTIATGTTVKGDSITISGGSVSSISTGKTCIQATNATDGVLNVGGNNATNIGVNCAGNVYSNNVSIYAQTGITETAKTITISGSTSANISGATINVSGGTGGVNISGATKISGDTTIGGDINLSGKTYFNNTCSSVASNELSEALCEIFSGSVVTMTREETPSDSRLSAIYRLWQNNAQIGYDINVPKDGFLKSVELVEVSGISYLRFIWNVYDAQTQTYSTGSTDVSVEDLVKQIADKNPTDNGTAQNHNVKLDVWYDATEKKMLVSGETTSTMNVTNLYSTGTTSAATVIGTTGNFTTLNAGATTISGATTINKTLKVTGDTTLAAVSASSVSATSVSSPTISGTNITAATKVTTKNLDVTGNAVITGTATVTGEITATSGFDKKLSFSSGAYGVTGSPYNGSGDTTVSIPKDMSDIGNRRTLTIQKNNSNLGTYDPGSTANTTINISVPTSTDDITNNLKYLKWSLGTPSADSTGYNGSSAKTITIPSKISNLTNDLSDLTIQYGTNVSNRTSSTTYNGSATKTVDVPTSLSGISNGNVVDSAPTGTSGKVTINKNVEVSGTVTATGAIYSSDRNLKEHIVNIPEQDIDKVGFVEYKTYNFKGEDNKMYGIIAQDLQEIGLGELVYKNDNDTLAVDYTSFMILQLARLKRDNEYMLNVIASLSERIKKLEGDKED